MVLCVLPKTLSAFFFYNPTNLVDYISIYNLNGYSVPKTNKNKRKTGYFAQPYLLFNKSYISKPMEIELLL